MVERLFVEILLTDEQLFEGQYVSKLSLKFTQFNIKKDTCNIFIEELFWELSHVIVEINQSFKFCQC